MKKETKKLLLNLFLLWFSYVLMFGLFFNDCYMSAKAQDDVESDQRLMGFDMTVLRKPAVESECFINTGSWGELDSKLLPQKPVRITSGNICKFRSQIIDTRKDGTEEHFRPLYAEFAFDHTNELEYIIFWFEYKTWAAREFGEQSFRRNKHLHFKSENMKLGSHPSKSSRVHGLNNLKFLSFTKVNSEEVFKLGIVMSREPFGESYTRIDK